MGLQGLRDLLQKIENLLSLPTHISQGSFNNNNQYMQSSSNKIKKWLINRKHKETTGVGAHRQITTDGERRKCFHQ